MKKTVALLLAVLLLTGVCAAAEEKAYRAPPLLDASEDVGVPTHYYLYDRDYYEAPCDQAGTVVKVKYATQVYDKKYTKFLNVYLPYGYDENGTERYPIVYFFHGRGCDPDTLIRNDETKNAFDHMIETGVARPFILVCATYYYGRGTNYDPEKFVQEFRTEIMPLVEGTYRTYAETADEAGFRASRDHRAISGFSMGSMVTWSLIDDMVDVSAAFLPFSAASGNVDALHAALEGQGRFFIYMASGGPNDGNYAGYPGLVKSLIADPLFSYGNDFQENNIYYVASDNIHQDLCSRYYLYNAFLDGLFR